MRAWLGSTTGLDIGTAIRDYRHGRPTHVAGANSKLCGSCAETSCKPMGKRAEEPTADEMRSIPPTVIRNPALGKERANI